MYKPEFIELTSIKIIGYDYQTNLNKEAYFNEIPGFYYHFGSNEYYIKISNRARPAFAYGIAHEY
ncbi:hypothetical protein ACFO9Q_04310 [Paenibacillus sp. GCM10023252]|uniref:hypothetical protein n=1 Tax=Paenibacillus sp. GCM10023252 TaxID=3252649 RepID=UPI003618BC0E